MKQTLTSINIAKDNFMFVPKMDWSNSYEDEDLFRYFGLSDEQKDQVNKIMRPIDLSLNDSDEE
jgi:site-specific DNA-methyltransferase (adenine-specific)